MFVNYVLPINVSIYNDRHLSCDKSILLLYMYNVNINLTFDINVLLCITFSKTNEQMRRKINWAFVILKIKNKTNIKYWVFLKISKLKSHTNNRDSNGRNSSKVFKCTSDLFNEIHLPVMREKILIQAFSSFFNSKYQHL